MDQRSVETGFNQEKRSFIDKAALILSSTDISRSRASSRWRDRCAETLGRGVR
jgi:hypothetical protein